MSEMTTAEKNEAIRQFMKIEHEQPHGYQSRYIDENGTVWGWCRNGLKFDSDWSWLMPVWRKLRESVWEHFGEYPSDFCAISDAWEQYCFIVDIDLAHDILYRAIQWYQKQKEQ